MSEMADNDLREQRKFADEAIKELREIQTNAGDTEADHFAADFALTNLLDQLGFSDVVAEFDKIKKWYA